jgi:hypothetical protein
MKIRPLFIVLAAAAAFAVIERDAVVEEWDAAYPSDPDKQSAIQRCFNDNHNFDRLSGPARRECYEKWLPIYQFIRNYRPSPNL